MIRPQIASGGVRSSRSSRVRLRHAARQHGRAPRSLLRQSTKPRAEKRTARQREVLRLLAEDHAMKEVADLLQVSARTVAFHKYTIMETSA
jgi:DNA-binding NarL/FixJ family response regulator